MVADTGSGQLLVFNGSSGGTFSREGINLTTFGGAPSAITLASFDSRVGVDIAVAIAASDIVLSPLTPNASSTGRWLPAIDFERDAQGRILRSGTRLEDEFASWGITVSGPANTIAKPSVLNWSRSVDASTPGASALGKVLTLLEYRDHDDDDDDDHDDHDHDDDEYDYTSTDYDRNEDKDSSWRLVSGPITFDFQSPVMLDQISLLGIKGGSSAIIKLFSVDGSLLHSRTVTGNINGGEQTIRLDGRLVARLVVELQGRGAISQLVFNREIPAGSRIQLAGSTQTNEGSVYSLNLASPLVTSTAWLVNWGDGHIDTIAGDPVNASHVFADGRSVPTVYATARDVLGNVYLANLWSIDVANVSPTLTIAGSNAIEAGQPYTLSLTASDPGQDRLQHWLIDWGDGSRSSLPGHATTATHTYKLTQSQPKAFTIRATARDEDSSSGSSYRSNELNITVSPDSSRVLPTINFERAGDGSILRAPVRLGNQFEEIGVTVSSTATFPRGPMIVDSSRPSASARDIGSPNSTYRGAGYGLGGMRGTTGANSTAHKNVLILASDVRATNPDDYESAAHCVLILMNL